jgi:SIR2-like domain
MLCPPGIRGLNVPTLPPEGSRQKALKFILHAANYGNLGLFVGAGLPMAVLNQPGNPIALCWGDLLRAAAKEMKIEWTKEIAGDGDSYPAIATKLCKKHSEGTRDYERSLKKLKSTIAHLTCWYPEPDRRRSFSGYLESLSPAWIITTNYDSVIETILTGKSVSLGPDDQLISPRAYIPIYHLHGRRTHPDELIVAQEDYVSLFRPNQYRQARLALALKESTVLLLGYALGDVNVLTALDWSKNVFANPEGYREYQFGEPHHPYPYNRYPHGVIQILRKSNPRAEPYRDGDVWVIETGELEAFFRELEPIGTAAKARADQRKDSIARTKYLEEPDEEAIKRFIEDDVGRNTTLHTLFNDPAPFVLPLISFLARALDATLHRYGPDETNRTYSKYLTIVLDLLRRRDLITIAPALFQSCALRLDHVGTNAGRTGETCEIWCKYRLCDEVREELRAFAEQYRCDGIKTLLGIQLDPVAQ